ncbi:MAG: hypothetical protein AAGF58_13975 [Pseudomonadota bacterium]
MKVTFRSLPQWMEHLPHPVLARQSLPEWLHKMPGSVESPLTDEPIDTLKKCPPFVDAMSAGFLIPLPCDIEVRDGEVSWDWDLPPSGGAAMSAAPLGLHLSDQLVGSPFHVPDQTAFRFMNFWTIECPLGVSLYCTHPVNRFDLPFRTLTGIVDCDGYKDGLVHFPAVWSDPNFDGVIPRGTPMVQCVPFNRESLELATGDLSDQHLENFNAVQEAVLDEPSLYRKLYRAPRG